MNQDRSMVTLNRLISLKREEMDGLRQDLARLDHLLAVAEQDWNGARKDEAGFLELTRLRESNGLEAHLMVERRRYLALLHDKTEEKILAKNQALAQRDQAMKSLEAAYLEIRALEKLSERRTTIALEDARRSAYMQADDYEIARQSVMGRGNDQGW